MKYCDPNITVQFVIAVIFINILSAQQSNETIRMEEIITTPGHFSIIDQAKSKLSLSATEIEFFPLIDNDIMRAAQIFPSVAMNDFSARFNIRGGEKDEVLVRIDGMELYEPFHLQDYGGAMSIIDMALLNRADLLMGGFPAKYGGKMSGVFDIYTRDGNRTGVVGNLGLDLLNAHLLLEGPLLKKGSWIFSARRGYFDLLLPMIFALLEEYDKEYKPQFADLYSKLIYDLSDRHQISMNIISTSDNNDVISTSPEENLSSLYRYRMFWIKWRHDLTENVWLKFFLFSGSSVRKRQEAFISQKWQTKDSRDLNYNGFKWELFTQLAEKHIFQLGLNLQQSKAAYDYYQSKLTESEGSFIQLEKTGIDLSAYIQDEWKMNSKLALNVGLHLLGQSYRKKMVDRYEIGPRIALAYKANRNVIFRTAWGYYHQPTHLGNLAIHNQSIEIGGSESASHFILGTEYRGLKKASILLEAYWKQLQDLTGRMNIYGRQPIISVAPDSGYSRGIELLVRHKLSNRISTNLGYGLAVAKENIKGKSYFRSFDRRHSANLNFRFQITNQSNLNLNWRFHSGEPTTEMANNLVLSADGTKYCKESVDLNRYNTERLPMYHSLDLRLTRFSENKNWDLSWYFQIINLYSRKNIDARVFKSVRDKETNVVIDCQVVDEPLLPILPTLGVNIRFP